MVKNVNKKLVYFFGEGNSKMKDLLGGKGANLAEMTNLGLPIPSGFTISTDVCKEYYVNNQRYPAELDRQLNVYLQKLEEKSGAKFGDPENPLLLSVRSGAPISMPGMMDTILNLGLTKETLIGLIQKTKDKRFVYDSYRRFLQMYGNVCLNIKKERFEIKIEEMKENKQVSLDTELTAEDLKSLIPQYKMVVEKKTKKPSNKISAAYELSGDSLKRKNKSCPKCGSGTFMGDHKDRWSCGKCGFMEKK